VKDFFKYILNACEWPEEKVERNASFIPIPKHEKEDVGLRY